jgi:hypothetical protein
VPATNPIDQTLPAWLAGPVEAVLADMSRPNVPRPVARYRDEPELEHFGTLTFDTPERDRFGFGVGDDETAAALLVTIADGIGENLPELSAYWAEAVPPCPGHDHPMRPVVSDAEAWWTCPADGRNVSLIGDLV